MKKDTKTINLKYQPQCGVMDHILYQIFKIILSIMLKKHEKLSDNPLLRIYVYKMENRITFEVVRGYYLKLLTPETMKSVVSTKIR